jgi:hypothetical protein
MINSILNGVIFEFVVCENDDWIDEKLTNKKNTQLRKDCFVLYSICEEGNVLAVEVLLENELIFFLKGLIEVMCKWFDDELLMLVRDDMFIVTESC